ncbi:MAG: hypothetical protein UT24_C0017G0018 [Candidatus Woesebacteria bacterium GW2011_GWB1_39_12]|uniref:Uncharacterized protein n=2 Tax=Candidatus Woeseibacteriota TaxID=1752722 RepID=A0A0G0QEH3_9BACT|nr:MAG: hypothetical protein UT24_C0017G0018 [Candidatus Woesebacteria bacterium GW2011_GWB1_39_12]
MVVAKGAGGWSKPTRICDESVEVNSRIGSALNILIIPFHARLLYVLRKMKNKSKTKISLSSLYVLCVILILIALSIFNLAFYLFKENREVLGTTTETSNEIGFWYDFLANNPTYKDGWLELARLEYDEGNLASAKESLEQAEKIDPNSEELLLMREKLGL